MEKKNEKAFRFVLRGSFVVRLFVDRFQRRFVRRQRIMANAEDRVFFAFDSSSLSDNAKEILGTQVNWLKKHENVNVVVQGYCDERGTREYNLALGERRASAVRDYLISQGIAADRISTISYGKERPAVLGNNEAAWAQNRRAVTVVKAGN